MWGEFIFNSAWTPGANTAVHRSVKTRNKHDRSRTAADKYETDLITIFSDMFSFFPNKVAWRGIFCRTVNLLYFYIPRISVEFGWHIDSTVIVMLLHIVGVYVFFLLTSSSDGLRYEHSQPLHSVNTVQVRVQIAMLARMWLWTHTLWTNSLCLFVLRCVTASASMTQQLLAGRTPHLKPFRVTNADRSKKKGIMADTLRDLINKVKVLVWKM